MTDASADFENSTGDLAPSPESKNFKFERPDWALFRTVQGLQQRAGVPIEQLRRLVVKELADNGLDNGARVQVSQSSDGTYVVDDDGPGIDPDDLPRLFSINRPMITTKLLRLPTRGALGNGLRVVAGAVLASSGKLTVTTRNRRVELRPERDGTTTVVSSKHVDRLRGMRIEIKFGDALPPDSETLSWAHHAIRFRGNSRYCGASSPHWYNSAQFEELISAGGRRPVRDLIATLDGCSGGKAGEIVNAAGLERVLCEDVTTSQAEMLLISAQRIARSFNPNRLGDVGEDTMRCDSYRRVTGFADVDGVKIPFVIEAWVKRAEKTAALCFVNRTPVTGSFHASRSKREINLFGCGLSDTVATAPADRHVIIVINIDTPYMPITSDGKAPNLDPFLDGISSAVETAVRKIGRPSGKKIYQKDVVLEHLDEAISHVRGDDDLRFNQRQLMYFLRPVVKAETGEDLKEENFNRIITDFENDNGEIEGMYREPRGSIIEPHTHLVIPLGTLTVERYERPVWTYNKVLYIEKEGWSEALRDTNWEDRHDCIVMSSKGNGTRAAKDLIDKLAEHDEEIKVFCVHDADNYGPMIFQGLQEATRARGARKIKIINLGLEPWEAVELGLEVEELEDPDRARPIADYVRQHPDGEYWGEWLQTHRVELNAMTTPEFIEWLDRKMEEHGGDEKLIPPEQVVADEFEKKLRETIREQEIERILREQDVDNLVEIALKHIDRPDTDEIICDMKVLLANEPERPWRDQIDITIDEILS